MKALDKSVLAIALLGVLVGGCRVRSASGQQTSAAKPTTENLPPDIRPDTRSRIAWPTRNEFTTDEDRSAYDRAIAARPEWAKIPELEHIEPGNGIRLHIPIVHIAYRDTIQNLNQKNGLDNRYHELATLVACRENNVEYDWVNHLTHNAVPLNIVEVLRSNKDTKGLDEKDAVLIQFGRELFRQPKVSSETFASMQRLFGVRGTLALTLIMAHYVDNGLLYRAYDQRLAPSQKTLFSSVLLGNGFQNAVANKNSATDAEKLPSDIRPDTLSRIAWPKRDEFTTQEDQSAYDRAVAARPSFAKAPDLAHEEPGNGIRLHIPVVHIAYRDTIQNLNQKNGLDPRYHELATLVACRENKVEFDWVNHLTHNAVPLDIVDVVRKNKDTKGLDEKDAVLIQFGRELFRQPSVSSATFAGMERLFGRRGTLALTLVMAHYTDNGIIYRAYDQRLPGNEHPFAGL